VNTHNIIGSTHKIIGNTHIDLLINTLFLHPQTPNVFDHVRASGIQFYVQIIGLWEWEAIKNECTTEALELIVLKIKP
jgi:hypothetical protein